MLKNKRILILEDNLHTAETYKLILEEENYDVELACNSDDFLGKYHKLLPDLLLMDIDLKNSDLNGLEVFKTLREKGDFTAKVIVITGKATRMQSIEAIKLGAYSFIDKAMFDRRKFLLEVKNALLLKSKEDENTILKDKVSSSYAFIGESKPIKKVKKMIENFAKIDSANVLIFGETGTGKEIVANQIYLNSQRSTKSFITVNIGGISEDLINSELFGHKKGSFTGAEYNKKGFFESAENGVLFLDEIANLSLDAQSKILRAIQQKEIQPIGELPKKIDVRLIFATNKDLWELVEKEKFKDDLYFRLEGNTINLPPLREREKDIILLMNFFFSKLKQNIYTPVDIRLERIWENLLDYKWPGNVRELQNFCEFLMITEDAVTNEVILEQLGKRIIRRKSSKNADNDLSNLLDIENMKESVGLFEEKYIQNHLEKNKWNRIKTAEKIGLEKSTLYKKMKKYGLIE